jgi:hypothetical protein
MQGGLDARAREFPVRLRGCHAGLEGWVRAQWDVGPPRVCADGEWECGGEKGRTEEGRREGGRAEGGERRAW